MSEQRGNVFLRFVKSYPTTFGIVIGLLLASIVVAIAAWFPRTAAAWERNNVSVRSVWCTVAFFVFCIYRFWRFRGRPLFWLSISVFFLGHITGIVYFSREIHPLSAGEWMLLLGLETVLLFFYFDWLDRKSRHVHRHPPVTNSQDDRKKTELIG